MFLRRLDREVINKLSSQASLPSFASCACELVKNSIDAGATTVHIDINIDQTSLSVTDNGSGLSYEELQSVARPHVTGNTVSLNDTITTYGFRGQALADISQLSLLTIESRVAGEKSYTLSIHQSKRLAIIPTKDINDIEYHSFGQQFTRVTVRNLFSNLPVRQMILHETPKTLYSVRQELLPILLDNSDVSFKLFDTGSLLLSLPCSNAQARAVNLFRNLHNDKIVDWYGIDETHFDISVRGIIAKPVGSFTNRQSQFIFVNSKLVNDASLIKEIEQLFRAVEFGRSKKRIHNGKFSDNFSYPPFMISLTVRQKLAERIEERVQDSPVIREATILTLKEFLENNLESPFLSHQKRLPFKVTKTAQEDSGSIQKLSIPHYSTYFNPENGDHQIERHHLASAKVIAQVSRKFILVKLLVTESCVTSPILAFIDQHAADERIHFDEQMKSLTSGPTSVKLIKPITLQDNLSLSQISQLSMWGFKTSDRKEVTHLPEILWEYHSQTDYIKEIIAECAFNLNSSQSSSRPITLSSCPSTLVGLITSKSCRNAIKFGDPLTLTECRYLVSKLSVCDNPFQCAHGRPSIIPIVNVSKIFDQSYK
jgi:DNA mismatch repair protein MLH3